MAKTFSELKKSFSYDKTATRYRGPDGRFVPEREIKRLTLTIADESRKDLNRLTAQLYRGDIRLDEWQRSMEDSIKNLHLAQAALGRGGFDNLNQADYGAAGAELRYQYERLDNFAVAIEGGMSEAQAQARANLYAASANGTYENFRRRDAKINGMTEERRVLGAAEHCRDCLSAAGRGWQEIGTLPQIGDSVCKMYCRCHFEYRRIEPEPDPEDESDTTNGQDDNTSAG